MTAVLQVEDLTKWYGRGLDRFAALNDVSLDVEAGTSLAIVGRSGSGKSTLMHLLALLDTPTTGTVRVRGEDASTLRSAELNRLRNSEFGFVFQQFFLDPKSTVLDNVALPLVIAGVPARARRRRALEALDRLGLADKARNTATELSGGQKQRVVIARALVNEPAVIFADEPTGNLDSVTGAEVEAMLFGLQQDRGITLVVVTHDEDLAARCERRVTMRDGVLDARAVLA